MKNTSKKSEEKKYTREDIFALLKSIDETLSGMVRNMQESNAKYEEIVNLKRKTIHK